MNSPGINLCWKYAIYGLFSRLDPKTKTRKPVGKCMCVLRFTINNYFYIGDCRLFEGSFGSLLLHHLGLNERLCLIVPDV